MSPSPQAWSSSELSASAILTWPVVGRLLTERGGLANEVTQQAGLQLGQLADARARVPLRCLQTLWRIGSERLEEPHLGIRAASDGRGFTSWPEPLSLCEHLFCSSATVREGIERLQRYARILRDGIAAHVEDGDVDSVLALEFDEEEPWPLVQLQLAMAVQLQRRVLPDSQVIREVWFRHQHPAAPEVFEQFFRVPVRFGAPVDGFLVARAALDAPLPGADSLLCQAAEWRSHVLLSLLPDCQRTSHRVREAVLNTLPNGDLRVHVIARRLGLSPRTLHRRLRMEGETYQSVLDKTRAVLAKRELSSGKYTIRDVALRVGFANVSAFHRAFKGWTGCTPTDFQARTMAQAGRATPRL